MTNLYTSALSVVKKLYATGYIAFFSGGWVRDFLMRRPSDDIDIVTNASIPEIQALFSKTIPVGIHFGIVIVVESGYQFEVATFRKDRPYLDGRRPIGVDKATPQEDSKRRDFTINGLFYDPLSKMVYDYVGGKRDLQKKLIRAIGDPHKRFLEDRLRMIRAIRYATCFDFSIEEKTRAAILDHAQTLFPAVSMERVYKEFSKMALFPNFNRALQTLHTFNLLPVIFPQLKGVSKQEIAKRTAFLPFFPQKAPLIAKILELFPSFSLKEKETLCSYLKCSKQDLLFIRYSHRFKEMAHSKQKRELYEWANLYAHPSYFLCFTIETLHLPFEEREPFLEKHEVQFRQLKPAIVRLQNKTPILTSTHLRLAGIKNGPQMGKLLKEGERLSINAGIEDPEKLLKKLLSP